MQGKQFDEDLNETEINAWLSCKRVCNDLLEITEQRTIRMLCRICLLRTKLWDAMESHLDFFAENRGKVTETLWLWKSGTKASGPQACWQAIAVKCRGMYPTPNSGESYKPLQFRGQFLPVS
jgi:hypothetical protein